jgi:hypothetical protein
MKLLTAAAIGALALNLSACAGISPLAVNPKTTPAAQKIQAEAKADFDRALAKRLEHCDIRGQIGADVSARVSTEAGAGINVGGSFTCLPRPWPNAAGAPPAQ